MSAMLRAGLMIVINCVEWTVAYIVAEELPTATAVMPPRPEVECLATFRHHAAFRICVGDPVAACGGVFGLEEGWPA